MDADDTHSVSPDLLRRLYPDTPSWQIWKRAPEEQQLDALAEIRSQQLLGALPYLAGIFSVGSEKVRENAAETVSALFSLDKVNLARQPKHGDRQRANLRGNRVRQLLGAEPSIVAGAKFAYIKLNTSTACPPRAACPRSTRRRPRPLSSAMSLGELK